MPRGDASGLAFADGYRLVARFKPPPDLGCSAGDAPSLFCRTSARPIPPTPLPSPPGIFRQASQNKQVPVVPRPKYSFFKSLYLKLLKIAELLPGCAVSRACPFIPQRSIMRGQWPVVRKRTAARGMVRPGPPKEPALLCLFPSVGILKEMICTVRGENCVFGMKEMKWVRSGGGVDKAVSQRASGSASQQVGD